MNQLKPSGWILFAALVSVSGYTRSQSALEQITACVVEWNHLGYRLAYEHDQFYSFIGIRTLTMMHLAIHDVLNAIEPKYERYAYFGPGEEADPALALSFAAYEVLNHAYPNRKDTLDKALSHWLQQADHPISVTKARAVGSKAARAIITRREGDGHQKQGDYTPMTKPGNYQYTPGWDNWVLKPDFNYARPFALDTITQFRSPPPPPLDSEKYGRSYDEVKMYGKKGSTARSEDETHYAHWWAEFAEHSWNRIGRIVANEKNMSGWDVARMFALLNMDIYDIYLASLESKYFYDTWRPFTAIRFQGDDHNRHTTPDPVWEPEMLTPPWPEYPSAHAAVGRGGAEIMKRVFGTSEISFSMESTSALASGRRRTYHKLDKAADECANSRIMNGYHFRFATEEGQRQGSAIASFICDNFLRPLNTGE